METLTPLLPFTESVPSVIKSDARPDVSAFFDHIRKLKGEADAADEEVHKIQTSADDAKRPFIQTSRRINAEIHEAEYTARQFAPVTCGDLLYSVKSLHYGRKPKIARGAFYYKVSDVEARVSLSDSTVSFMVTASHVAPTGETLVRGAVRRRLSDFTGKVVDGHQMLAKYYKCEVRKQLRG